MTVFQSGGLVDDINGRVLYRRRRTCTNIHCEFYLIAREAFEFAAPLTSDMQIVSPYLSTLSRIKLPRRTAPLPELPSHPNEL
ncbi:hypothetical protein [Deinococcus sp. PEB2-63]